LPAVSDPETRQFSLADARRIAMDLLARREHSVLELHRKLGKRAIPEELIQQALQELLADDLLSETRFAESFVSSRIQRGQGPVRIRGDLLERGVPEGLIEQALEEADCDWSELAKQVRAKRFGRGTPENFPERARQSRFLQYRGFSSEQIRAAVGDN
jgi:regulatory protein